MSRTPPALVGLPLTLHGYWRSSASYRVRIVLAHKGLAYTQRDVNLVKNEQLQPEFLRLSPQGLVPVLEVGPHVLIESLAICEALEELVPEPALLPADPWLRAEARALALTVAAGIHPLQNLRVLRGLPEDQRKAHAQRVIGEGLAACEALLRHGDQGPFALGARVSLADVVLVPQIYNARRFEVDMAALPKLTRLDAACAALPAFQAAHPDAQPGAAPARA